MCCAAATPLCPSKTQYSPNESSPPSLLCLHMQGTITLPSGVLQSTQLSGAGQATQVRLHRAPQNALDRLLQCSHLTSPVLAFDGVSLHKPISRVRPDGVSWYSRAIEIRKVACSSQCNTIRKEAKATRNMSYDSMITLCWRNVPEANAGRVICFLPMSQSRRLMLAADWQPPHCLHLSSLSCLRLLEAQCPAPESSSRALQGQHPAQSHKDVNRAAQDAHIASRKRRTQNYPLRDLGGSFVLGWLRQLVLCISDTD